MGLNTITPDGSPDVRTVLGSLGWWTAAGSTAGSALTVTGPTNLNTTAAITCIMTFPTSAATAAAWTQVALTDLTITASNTIKFTSTNTSNNQVILMGFNTN